MELHEALHKIEEQAREIEMLRRRLKQLADGRKRYRERFTVRTFKGEKVINVKEIRYIVSENKCTYIVLHDGTSFDFDMTLAAIETLLDPSVYMRVNRKYIVPVGEVECMEQDINGKERLILRKGKKNPEITVSRDKKHEVHDWIDGCTRHE